MNKEPIGYTLFCDDIRLEVGNKVTLVGIYTTGMVVPQSFPITLPKFCLWINYQEPMDATWREIKFQVLAPGQEKPIAESVLELETFRQTPTLPPTIVTPADNAPRRSWYFPIAFAPLV